MFAECVFVAQSCPTLCDPMDCSPPGSSVHGILQARILEWVAIPFSKGSSWPRDRTRVSCIVLFFSCGGHQSFVLPIICPLTDLPWEFLFPLPKESQESLSPEKNLRMQERSASASELSYPHNPIPLSEWLSAFEREESLIQVGTTDVKSRNFRGPLWGEELKWIIFRVAGSQLLTTVAYLGK